MPRRAGTRLSGKRAPRKRARAAGSRYSRLAPGSLERVCGARTGCRATRCSAWRQELQAVPAGRVSGGARSKGHFRLMTPPTCWSAGAPAHWPLLDGPGRHGGVGGGHWGGGPVVWPGCGAPPGGAAVRAILAGPRALALSGASSVDSCPATPQRFPLSGGDTPWAVWLAALLRAGARRRRAVSGFPAPPPLPGVNSVPAFSTQRSGPAR